MDALNNAHTVASPSLWWAVTGVVLIFFLVYSAILVYHWFAYSMRPSVSIVATILYIVISAVFLFSLIAYTLAL